MSQNYQMTPDELRAVQLIELELLCEVDRICLKNNIPYRIVAGTLLGAVRHGGFIPWDDDADTAFLRDEYERFREACETDLDTSRFYFQDHRNTHGYRWGYGKLRRKGTEFIRLKQEHMPYEQGIFIDIFPYDNVPDNYFLRCIHCFRCFLYRKTFWSEVGKNTAKGIGKFIYILLSKIPANKLYKSYNKFIKKSNERESQWIRILTFPTPTKDFGYKRKWANEISRYLFEGIKLCGVAEYDEYMTFKYGDYINLPPENQRKTHPISKLKLLGGLMRKFRILQFPVRNTMGGITQYALNNWKHIDKSHFQFDFATIDTKLDCAYELIAQGCEVHYISCYYENNPERFVKEFNAILDRGYDAIHLHTSYWKSFIVEELAIAKNVPIIIVHSHNSDLGGMAASANRKETLKIHNKKKAEFATDLATHFCACSNKAADWLFGEQIPKEKIQILPNAIDVERFAFNPAIREKYRKELVLENDFVIGHVGRFEYQKNHDFLINIFNEVSKIIYNAKLLLIGDGELFDEIKEKVNRLNLADKVLFLGRRTDVSSLYQAMDTFVLTSHFEGLAIVLIEAQCSGATTTTTNVTMPENTITDLIEGLPFDLNLWRDRIVDIANDGFERRDYSEEVTAAGYSIKRQIKILENIYSKGEI
jgi:phosphorylcholine metabolism protein LicD/phosphopantetheinyl transferase (holo-ACP synthase)